MFGKKFKVKHLIKSSKKAIENLEKKRERSLAALLEAMLNNVEPAPEDVEFFKTYTAMIAVERENISKLFEELRPVSSDEENTESTDLVKQ